eukprot:TRINITY_DN3635_c0_g1_i2.p3 TRINITY_DN3635_c0_g1~~TRINITY_DN3635_c0_g1_i2.p3  ORF type:complete len:148 (+),score=45.19 TRINITY_DN3635_c0_g1_i2:319-762(+)
MTLTEGGTVVTGTGQGTTDIGKMSCIVFASRPVPEWSVRMVDPQMDPGDGTVFIGVTPDRSPERQVDGGYGVCCWDGSLRWPDRTGEGKFGKPDAGDVYRLRVHGTSFDIDLGGKTVTLALQGPGPWIPCVQYTTKHRSVVRLELQR